MRKDAILIAIIEKKLSKKVIEVFKRTKKAFKKKFADTLFRLCLYPMTRAIPVKENKIMFITFRGEYDCNAKWIAEEIRKRELPYEVVWTIRKKVPVKDIPKTFIKTYRSSYDFYRHLSSAKIIVDNGISTAFLGYKKKKNQILVETWHGSLGIKMFSKETNKDKNWCARAEKEGKMTDYCLSNSTFEDKVFTDTFWADSTILQLGHARNDILCERDTERLEAIRKKVYKHFDFAKYIKKQKVAHQKKLEVWYREKLGMIPCTMGHLDKENPFDMLESMEPENIREFLQQEYAQFDDLRICLYAPTFRDDGDMRPYKINYTKLRKALSTRFGGNWVILTRFHFRLLKKLKDYKFPAGVINASKYSDIQELLTCVDVGITDYSSWICDYMLTRKPGFLFATDMVRYEEKDREFFYPLNTMPFPLALNNDELIENILNFEMEPFVEQCDAFLADKGCIDDGHASERIVDAIERMMRGEKL